MEEERENRRQEKEEKRKKRGKRESWKGAEDDGKKNERTKKTNGNWVWTFIILTIIILKLYIFFQ